MKQLSPQQSELVSSLTHRLGAIPGIKAVVLGGSHARGRARPGSDIDLYVYYSEETPFSIESIRELAETVNDTAGPVVTDFYGWGPWVNGGAWLTVNGQRALDLRLRRLAIEPGSARLAHRASLPDITDSSASMALSVWLKRPAVTRMQPGVAGSFERSRT